MRRHCFIQRCGNILSPAITTAGDHERCLVNFMPPATAARAHVQGAMRARSCSISVGWARIDEKTIPRGNELRNKGISHKLNYPTEPRFLVYGGDPPPLTLSPPPPPPQSSFPPPPTSPISHLAPTLAVPSSSTFAINVN